LTTLMSGVGGSSLLVIARTAFSSAQRGDVKSSVHV